MLFFESSLIVTGVRSDGGAKLSKSTSSSLYISINETKTVYRVDLSLVGDALEPRLGGNSDTGLSFTLVEKGLEGARIPEVGGKADGKAVKDRFGIIVFGCFSF